MAEQGEEGGEVLLQAHVTGTVRKPRGRTKTYPRAEHQHEQGPARNERQYVIGPLWTSIDGSIILDERGHPYEVIFLDT